MTEEYWIETKCRRCGGIQAERKTFPQYAVFLHDIDRMKDRSVAMNCIKCEKPVYSELVSAWTITSK